MEIIDARQVIYDFLAELPATIKTEELFFLLIYCNRHPSPMDRDSFLAQAEIYLKQPAMAGVGAVLCARAILDFRLASADQTLLKAERLIKNAMTTDPNLPDMGLLGMPLRRLHYAAALDKWKTLRSNQLNEKSIRDFENSLLNPPPDIEP